MSASESNTGVTFLGKTKLRYLFLSACVFYFFIVVFSFFSGVVVVDLHVVVSQITKITLPPPVASHILYLFLAGHLHEKCAKLPVYFRHNGLLSTHLAKFGAFEPRWTQATLNQSCETAGHLNVSNSTVCMGNHAGSCCFINRKRSSIPNASLQMDSVPVTSATEKCCWVCGGKLHNCFKLPL